MTTFLSAISIAELSEAHIVRLIADSVAESRDLDYNRSPYGDDREAKREFLKDVTALANTFNGHLIIGMAEVDGIASGLERHCCGQLGHHCGRLGARTSPCSTSSTTWAQARSAPRGYCAN